MASTAGWTGSAGWVSEHDCSGPRSSIFPAPEFGSSFYRQLCSWEPFTTASWAQPPAARTAFAYIVLQRAWANAEPAAPTAADVAVSASRAAWHASSTLQLGFFRCTITSLAKSTCAKFAEPASFDIPFSTTITR